jgi:hypothetical protein
MDADRSREAMTESVVDREMQTMLAVDPSPEFVARVRARIAEESHSSRWWTSWTFAAVAAAAAVAIAAFVARPAEQTTSPARVAPDIASAVTGPAKAGGSVPPREQPTSTQHAAQQHLRSDSRRAGRGPAQTGSHAPDHIQNAEILIDARESAALRALILGIHSGAVDLQPVFRLSAPSAMELPPIGEIAIQPITIDPLEEGVRQ